MATWMPEFQERSRKSGATAPDDDSNSMKPTKPKPLSEMERALGFVSKGLYSVTPTWLFQIQIKNEKRAMSNENQQKNIIFIA